VGWGGALQNFLKAKKGVIMFEKAADYWLVTYTTATHYPFFLATSGDIT
jgi:hypothetical protein